MDLTRQITGPTGADAFVNGQPVLVRDVIRDALLARGPADEGMSQADKDEIAALLAGLSGDSLDLTADQRALLLDRVTRFNPPYVVEQLQGDLA